MNSRKILFFTCLVVSVGCLALGYDLAGQWVGVVLALFSGFMWLLARKYPGSWFPHICLLGSVCLAVIGQLSSTPPFLLTCGAGFALAAWDLFFLNDALKNTSYTGQTRRYENKHIQSLSLAVGFGLLAAYIGQSLHIAIPFFVTMLLVTLVLLGFERIWAAIKKRNMQVL